jgi:hypothetical protein
MDTPEHDENDARLITRLVDHAAGDGEDGAARALAARRPGLDAEIAAPQRVATQLRSSGPPVPAALVASVTQRVQERYGASPARAGSARAAVLRWRPVIFAPAAALAAAVVVVVVLIAGGGSATSGPSIERAAQLAFAPATRPAPAARDAHFLDVSYGGVTFPNYAGPFGVTPSGERFDRIAGRPALTVFYRLRDGARLSYTVFAGRAVPRPAAARMVTFQGAHLHVFVTRSGLAVVTLVRFGRTCVLAAPTARDVVLALAAEPLHVQA